MEYAHFPALDKFGNSVRGGEFLAKLSEQFAFHHFDNLNPSQLSNKLDPRRSIVLGQLSFCHSSRPSINISETESAASMSDSVQSPTDGIEI